MQSSQAGQAPAAASSMCSCFFPVSMNRWTLMLEFARLKAPVWWRLHAISHALHPEHFSAAVVTLINFTLIDCSIKIH